jgi:hypothetical protein
VSVRTAPAVQAPAADVEVRVARGVFLSGRLVDEAGRPVATGYLEARPVPPAVGTAHWVNAGPDGRFHFLGVPAGTVELRARLGEKTVLLGRFTAPADDLEVQVEP